MNSRPISPHIQDSLIGIQRRALEKQLANLQNALAMAEHNLNFCQEEQARLLEELQSLKVKETNAEDTILSTRSDLAELEVLLAELKIPSDRMEDPHTGLFLPVKRICGENVISETTFVGVHFNETDATTRWISLEDICKHNTTKKLYDSWKALEQQYKQAIPTGMTLSTEEEFTKAISSGWQPSVPSTNLLPVFQMHTNAPKQPFTSFVNCIETPDYLHAVVMTSKEQRVVIPLHAIEFCPLAKSMWNRWLNMRYDCVELGIPMNQDENYTYQVMANLQADLAASPFPSPKRQRKN